MKLNVNNYSIKQSSDNFNILTFKSYTSGVYKDISQEPIEVLEKEPLVEALKRISSEIGYFNKNSKEEKDEKGTFKVCKKLITINNI